MQELALVMAGERVDAPESFEAIVMRYERQVLMTALRLLNGDLEDARDAAQQSFLRLHRHWQRFDESRPVGPWLYRITVNVCRDIARARAARPMLALEHARNAACEPAGDSALIVAEALASLPEKERAAIVLRDIEGLSTKEVARILGSSEGTVRSQISHARLKIRKYLGRRP